ncbi:MAG TPA: universal stress protein [Chloroflexia bacterium]|nr:universal stress protein [Chloroflexia bacterium]
MKSMVEEGLPGAASDAVPLSLSPATVLVPMLNLGVAEGMIDLAATLAAGAAPLGEQGALQPRVVVLGVVEVPGDQPLTTGLDMARSYRALLDFLPGEVESSGRRVRVDRLVKVARSVSGAVHEAACDEQAGLVLFYWKGYAKHPRRHIFGGTLDAALQDPPYDVVLVRPEGWRDAKRVLLPVRGGPSAERALKLALTLAESLNLPLTVTHNVPTMLDTEGETVEGKTRDVETLGEEPYILFNEHLQVAQESASVPVESILTIGGDPAAALTQEIHGDDLVIMGMAMSSPVGRGPGARGQKSTRPISLSVARKKGLPLLVLRAAGHVDMASYARKARGSASRSGRSRSGPHDMPFERWFVENTYHGDEFKDPEEFLKLKWASGLSISIGLLTSNDEKQTYSMLTGLKRVLHEMHPIADQIVVVDAGSTDGTIEMARSLGVEVYSAEELLPGQGSLYGRGESWWKSLSVLRGDVCVWLDPKARRFHPTTAMSLAGPLLRAPTIQLVKAFETPQSGSDKRKEEGEEGSSGLLSVINWGGTMLRRREREVGILAGRIKVQALKPSDLDALSAGDVAALPPHTLLQVLYPPLSGVIAPFSREMAGRREAMLSIPAFAGENHEIGLLLSVAVEYGTRAIAQVELRHARLTPEPQPSVRSAIDVLQALEKRLPDMNTREYATRTEMRLQKELEGNNASSTSSAQEDVFEVRALGPLERPPMREVVRSD